MAQYTDGSVLAQLGNPDMRTPIAHALAYPARIQAGVDMLDLAKHGRLDFETVSMQRYPCLELAYDALRAGQSACIVLNAANEMAVQAFLDGQAGYLSIAKRVRDTLTWHSGQSSMTVNSLDDILALDTLARHYAKHWREPTTFSVSRHG